MVPVERRPETDGGSETDREGDRCEVNLEGVAKREFEVERDEAGGA